MKKIALLSFVLIVSYSHAQTTLEKELEKIYSKLDSVDLKSFKTDNFLNQGFLIESKLDLFKRFNENPEENNVDFNSPNLWKSRQNGLAKSNTSNVKSYANFESVISKYEFLENTIPIGIIYQRGELLEQYEIDENIKAKKKGYRLNKEYKKIDIFNASVLKTKAYASSVNFTIDNDLFDVERKGYIKEILIDFSDGRGFRKVESNETVLVKYEIPGEKAIAIKFKLPNNEFTSYSVINIVPKENHIPDKVFTIGSSNSSARLIGGRAELFTGCDNVLDRPVIVVSGFDALNTEDIINIRGNFMDANIDQVFRNNGYDMIYLDYSEGGADIRSNAGVLQQLIRDVNIQKTGNHSIIVIGISMGGLVSRWALTDMEENNQTHNVSHFISFDSPHLGANVPVGYQKLVEYLDDNYILGLIPATREDIDDALASLNSIAAKQMLLRYKGPNPHNEYTLLQNEFNNLGFPQQNNIRNLSIVNGAANGLQQAYNPNNLILDVNWFGVIQLFIEIRTNQINGNGLVSAISATGGPIYKSHTFNFNALNFDIAAGGTADNGGAANPQDWFRWVNAWEWFGGTTIDDFGRGEFAFVPLFSSTASTFPRINQNEINRSVNDILTLNRTPFDDIYAENVNSGHIDALDIQGEWIDLLQTEIGIPFTAFGCPGGQGNMIAPAPRFNTTKWYMCQSESRDFWVYQSEKIENLYNYQWQITGPWSAGGVGETFRVPSGIPVGTYTINLTRSFDPASGITGNASAYSRTFTVYSNFHPTYGCSNNGGPGGTPGPTPRVDIGISNADTAQYLSDLITWPNPVSGELMFSYQLIEDNTISIELIPLSEQVRTRKIIITDSFRPEGIYNEKYYTNKLPNGLYLLVIKTDHESLEKKIIIKN